MLRGNTKDKYGRNATDKPKITTLPPEKMTPAPDLAEEICDPENKKRYKRGKFLGKVIYYVLLSNQSFRK